MPFIKVSFPLSNLQTQSQKVTIPFLKSIIDKTVDNGTIKIDKIEGNEVTITVSGGSVKDSRYQSDGYWDYKTISTSLNFPEIADGCDTTTDFTDAYGYSGRIPCTLCTHNTGGGYTGTYSGQGSKWLDSSYYVYYYAYEITIIYDEIHVPTMPTNLLRGNLDATIANDFAWQFNDPKSDDFQIAFQIQIIDSSTGTTVKDTGKILSSTTKYTLALNSLVNGKQYQWRIKTWDTLDAASPWSNYASFYTNGKPVVAITSPGTTINKSIMAVNWTFSDPNNLTQIAYEIILLTESDAVLWHSGKVYDRNSRFRTIDYQLANNTTYKIMVIAYNDKDIASLPDIKTFNVVFTPPAKPLLTITKDEERACVKVVITYPVPTILQPSIINADLFRRVDGGAWIRISTGTINSYVDCTPGSDMVYEYKIRAYGNNSTNIESDIVAATMKIKNAKLSLVSDFSVYVNLIYNPSKNEKISREKTYANFAGRQYPVEEIGEKRSLNLETSFTILDKIELDLLRHLADLGEYLLYRDSRGRREFVSIGDLSISDEPGNKYKISLSMIKISYEEAV